MVDMVKGLPGGTPPRAGPGQNGPGGPGGRPAPGRPGSAAGLGRLLRRRRLVPYLLLLPSVIAIGLVLVWPTLQIGLLSFQIYGLPQVTGAQPTQWVGLSNYAAILRD